MNRLSVTAFLILSTLVGFCQSSSFWDLQIQLSQAGYDTSKSIDTYIIVSDEISENELAFIAPLLNWWEKPISHAHFILSGKEKRFKKLFSEEQLKKRNLHLDKSGVLKQRLGDQFLIEIVFTWENKILKKFKVDKDNLQAAFAYLEQWQLGLMDIPDMHRSTLNTGQTAPVIDEVDTSDQRIFLDSLKGKVVILNFWSETCTACILEMPLLNRLSKEYEGKNVLLLSVYKNSEESLSRFFKEGTNPNFGKDFITFPIISDATDVIEDYEVKALPMTYTIDPDGHIYRNTRFVTTSNFENFTYQALKGQIERLLAIEQIRKNETN